MINQLFRPIVDGVYEHKGSVISVGYGNNLAISEKKPRMKIWVGELPASWRLCEAVPLPGPDWSQAPEGAQWWAVDAPGYAYWFELEPSRDDEATSWDGGGYQTYAGDVDIPLGVDWRLLKAKRPAPKPDAQEGTK